MILAAGDGNWGVLVLMAVFGLISWLSSKFNESKNPPASGKPSSPAASPKGPITDPEEERMKKFLEALGIPTDAPEPRREVRREPVEPQRPQPTRRPLPVPPIVAQPPAWPKPQKREVPAPPPLPPSRRRSLDEAPAPSAPAETITLAALEVPAVAGYETVSSSISAVPHEKRTVLAPLPEGAPLAELVRRGLSSPEQLRTAFLLSEILGPPRGLQS